MKVLRETISMTIVIVLSVLALEAGSFAYFVIEAMWSGQGMAQALDATLGKSPLYAPKLFFGNYDPLHRQYLEPGRVIDNLAVNQWGFFGNGRPDPALEQYPAKPGGVFRVILFGGSSAAGIGASANDRTIAAQLEAILNASATRRYQVLNFGIPGGYTFYELTKYFGEAMLLEPDLVLFLDGWNDNVVTMEDKRVHVPHVVLNWDFLAYQYFEALHGLNVGSEQPPRVLTYAYLLARRLSDRLIGAAQIATLADRTSIYRKHPLFPLTERLLADPALPGRVFQANIETMAAASRARRILFLHYLQPYPQYRKSLTAGEKERIAEMHAQYEKVYGPEWAERAFVEHMTGTYAQYRAVEHDLAEKYRSDGTVRFYDITDIFSTVSERTYADIIHYTDLGQRLLAERFAADVREIRGNGS
jgi:hypothetical protein